MAYTGNSPISTPSEGTNPSNPLTLEEANKIKKTTPSSQTSPRPPIDQNKDIRGTSINPGDNGNPVYESYQQRNFPKLEGALSRYVPKKFGYKEDYIEIHIYDSSRNLLFSDENFTAYSPGETESNTGLVNELNLDPVNILNEKGYAYGNYFIAINIQRRKLFNTLDRIFIVREISSNRREMKAIIPSIENKSILRYFNDFRNEITGTPFFKDFVLNFDKDRQITCINVGLNDREDQYQLLFRSLDRIPVNVNLGDTFRVSEDIIDRLFVPVDLGQAPLNDYSIYLKGPNFKIDTRINSSMPSAYKNYNEILEFQVSGSYERLINTLHHKEVPNIQYDYIRPVSQSSIGENIEDTYHFENFVHFGSAVERLKNFQYKVKLVELYSSQLSNLNQITGATSASVIVGQNKTSINNKRQKLVQSFDGYEKFLYYTSGSIYTWPKSSTSLVSGAYSLHSVSSSDARVWLGSENDASTFYGGQLKSASLFDRENPHNLERLIPTFIRNNKQNDEYKLFYHMIGQHFDHIWTYIKHITEQNNSHHIKGVSKDLVYHTLKSLGLETFDQFENSNIIEYVLGQGTSGSAYLNTTYSGSETLVTASNEGSLPKGDITRNIWKRLYHNAPYLLKTKGTERGLRALISCYGVPSSILNIKEYGGATKDASTYKVFSYDKSSLTLNGATGNNGYFIKTNWSSSLTDAMSASAKTVEFRIKPKLRTSVNDATTYHLFSLSGSKATADPFLILEPYIDHDISSSEDAKTYGKISLAFNGSTQASTINFPVYNGEFWNVFIGTKGISGSSAEVHFGAYQSNFLKHTSYYTSSATQTEHDRAVTFGDPVSSSENTSTGPSDQIGGANFVYFGGTELNGVSAYDNYDGLTYSGSLQEIRYHFGELLSHSTLTKHSLEPFMYSGNQTSSAFSNVVLRLPLGSNNKQNSQSHHPNISKEYIANNSILSSMSTQKWDQIDEVHHLPTPDTVGISATSEKVRIDEGSIDKNILSPFIKAETSTQDRQPLDYEDLGIFLSPTNEINEDIIYTLGSFRLDDYIGNPLPSAQTSSFYPDLKNLKEVYFQKVKRRFNYWDYIKTIQYIDHTLFKLIEQWVPMKANTKTGLLIEPHYLERSKFARQIPTISDNQTMTVGSYNTLNFSLDADHTNFTFVSSSVITTNNLKKIGSKFRFATVGDLIIGEYEIDHPHSTTAVREEQGTNTTIDISTSNPNRIVLSEKANTTYNTQFAQAPIKPFLGTKPEGYKSYSSNIILGNATKAQKSSIYYRITNRGKQTDF